jgi:hypothetical protein
MKIFAICLVWTILIVALFKMFESKIVQDKSEETEPESENREDLKWVDELINNTLKIKQ